MHATFRWLTLLWTLHLLLDTSIIPLVAWGPSPPANTVPHEVRPKLFLQPSTLDNIVVSTLIFSHLTGVVNAQKTFSDSEVNQYHNDNDLYYSHSYQYASVLGRQHRSGSWVPYTGLQPLNLLFHPQKSFSAGEAIYHRNIIVRATRTFPPFPFDRRLFCTGYAVYFKVVTVWTNTAICSIIPAMCFVLFQESSFDCKLVWNWYVRYTNLAIHWFNLKLYQSQLCIFIFEGSLFDRKTWKYVSSSLTNQYRNRNITDIHSSHFSNIFVWT